MAIRGRKPKPTAVKVLEGNPGKRALNTQEPKPLLGAPERPPHLKGKAYTEWYRVTKQLEKLRLLSTIDRAVLASYCVAYQHWADAEEKLQIEGMVIITVNGNVIQNPYLSISNRAMEQMVKFAAEFGMTPSSRARLKVETPSEEDEMATLLSGKASPTPAPGTGEKANKK
jgi:P27 family predicted phage terminase small subunit